MIYKIGLICTVAVALMGCADDRFDATSRALRGVSSSMRGVDETVERATGFSFFGALRDRVEDELVPYEDGQWVFPTGRGKVTIAFEEADGQGQQFPSDTTNGMEIALIEEQEVGGLLDLPGDHRATTTKSSATRGFTQDAVSVSVAYTMEYAHALKGLDVSFSAQVEAAVTIGNGCPVGQLSGTVTASGETPVRLDASRSLEFEAEYDGRDLVWRAFDGDQLVDDGRVAAVAASGC